VKILLLTLLSFVSFWIPGFSQNAPLEGCAFINAENMNILYIGIDNPISASAPGISPDSTIVSAGTLRNVGITQFVIKPYVDGPRVITITVSIKTYDGKIMKIRDQIYRVRKIPNPEVLFGVKIGGIISKETITTVAQINAGLGEGFGFEGLRYRVNSYKLIIARQSGESYFEEVTGDRISAKSRVALETVKSGDVIVISNVEATGPAGKVILSGVTLTVQ
jgi:hypothetical protein